MRAHVALALLLVASRAPATPAGVSWEVYLDRAAIVEARRTPAGVIARLASGHLVRYDERTLAPSGERVGPEVVTTLGAPLTDGRLLVGVREGGLATLDPRTLTITPRDARDPRAQRRATHGGPVWVDVVDGGAIVVHATADDGEPYSGEAIVRGEGKHPYGSLDGAPTHAARLGDTVWIVAYRGTPARRLVAAWVVDSDDSELVAMNLPAIHGVVADGQRVLLHGDGILAASTAGVVTLVRLDPARGDRPRGAIRVLARDGAGWLLVSDDGVWRTDRAFRRLAREVALDGSRAVAAWRVPGGDVLIVAADGLLRVGGDGAVRRGPVAAPPRLRPDATRGVVRQRLAGDLVFDRRAGRVRHGDRVVPVWTPDEAPRQEWVHAATVDGPDRLLVVSHGRLCALPRAGGPCAAARDVPNPGISQLARDGRGRLWLGGWGVWLETAPGRYLDMTDLPGIGARPVLGLTPDPERRDTMRVSVDGAVVTITVDGG